MSHVTITIEILSLISGYAEMDNIIQSKIMVVSANEFQCTDCPHVSRTKQNLSVHIEANHVKDHPGVLCSICSKVCTTRDALRKHMVRYHTERPNKLLNFY